MLSPTYEITTALSHTDELISPPYDIAIVTISYGRVIMSSVWDSMMSKKNVGWPFYAAVVYGHNSYVTLIARATTIEWNYAPRFRSRKLCSIIKSTYQLISKWTNVRDLCDAIVVFSIYLFKISLSILRRGVFIIHAAPKQHKWLLANKDDSQTE